MTQNLSTDGKSSNDPVTQPRQKLGANTANALADAFQALPETAPPSQTKTKGQIVRENQEAILRAIENGWTQRAIVDFVQTKTQVSITTETLRANLPARARPGKRGARKSVRTKAKNAAKRDKRNAQSAAQPKRAVGDADDAEDTGAGDAGAGDTGAGDTGAPTGKGDTPRNERATGDGRTTDDGTAAGGGDPEAPADGTDRPWHAGLQDDY